MAKKSLSICKKIFYNPLFVSLLLTTIIIIIIVAIYKVQSFGAGMIFKCGFYVFIMLSVIIYVHDFLITRELKTNSVNKEVKDVFSGIDISKEISHDVIQVDPIIYEKDESDDKSYEKTHERFNKLLNNENSIHGGENSNRENSNHENSNHENSSRKNSNYENSSHSAGTLDMSQSIETADVNNILSSIVEVTV
jgi:hypothetical protein